MTHVDYWPVGASTSTRQPFGPSDISSHLAEDWVPSLAASVGLALASWPVHLTETIAVQGSDYLALRAEAGRSDRQWKGMLSWMLGVAATREILFKEGYTWIAPLSAFYPGGANTVDIARPHPLFPRSAIVADKKPGSLSRLRPDYIALRRNSPNGQYEWALVEAKGTLNNLKSKHVVPAAWGEQSRNAVVTAYGRPVTISRNLVVAARSNPSATMATARRIQIRAWNFFFFFFAGSEELMDAAALDVVAAHLFGFCRNHRLIQNARAIALATARRRAGHEGEHTGALTEQLRHVSREADGELRQVAGAQPQEEEGRWSRARIAFSTDAVNLDVSIEPPTVSLIRTLGTDTPLDEVVDMLRQAESELVSWHEHVTQKREEGSRVSYTSGGVSTISSEGHF